jgi:uroporphyrinogen decarboxylase
MRTPRPDSSRFINYLMGYETGRPPLIEYLVDEVVMRPILKEYMNLEWVPYGQDRDSQKAYLDNFIAFWHGMGYDFVRFEQNMGFLTLQVPAKDTAQNSPKTRMWVDTQNGMITNWAEFESYAWPRIQDVDFFAYDYLNNNLPEGMGLIVSHAAGIFEHLSQIMSYKGLCLALYDQPDLVKAITQALGERLDQFYNNLVTLDRVIAIFPGDDMGFRSGTLVSPQQLRNFILPWHKRFAYISHERGLPYFLHSCGNIASILDDLIFDVKIDGKHSFEDAILSVDRFQEITGGKIASLGGVDVHLLANGSPTEIRKRVRYLTEVCSVRGRYAVGSGNSIPSYIPVENYLAMVDEARCK